METDELVKKVIRWGRDKGLNDPKAQLNKVTEVAPEVNEKHRARMIAFNSQQYGKWWQKEGAREKKSRELSEYLLARPLLRKKCVVCGNTFECKNSNATYCSSRCRQENYFKKGVVLWHQKKKITK